MPQIILVKRLLKTEDWTRIRANSTFDLQAKAPMWIGEFGAFMADSNSSQTWLQQAVKIFEEYHTGWAGWAFYQTRRQPIPSFLSVSNS